MKTDSPSDIFQKIRVAIKHFEKSMAAGEYESAGTMALEAGTYYRHLAKDVPLRNLEYLTKAKEWERKAEDLEELQKNAEKMQALNPGPEVPVTGSGKKNHRVFISYSNPDKDVALSICTYLESKGITCWIAPRDVVPSAHYPSSIIDAISECAVVLLVFSRHSNRSPHVFRELGEALAVKKPILPFRIEDEPPSKEMRYFINIHQWMDAFEKAPAFYFPELLLSVSSLTIAEKTLPEG
jgi:hypothetical protein